MNVGYFQERQSFIREFEKQSIKGQVIGICLQYG